MTKDQIAQQLKEEFAKGNLKPSQLKRSLSTGDILPNPSASPLKKSQSQEQINSPEWQKQISSLQDELIIERKKVDLLREDLGSTQDKLKIKEQTVTDLKTQNSELEEQYFAARLKNLQDFGEYYTEKKALKNELELNINEGVQEIQRLENKLIALHRKKLQMQAQLKQSELKNTQLELKAIDCEQPAIQPVFNLN